MSIIKNDIPILEYDADPAAVIMPDHEHIEIRLPKNAVFAFLRDDVDRYAEEHHATVAARFISATKKYPLYILDVNGQQICLMQAPVGAPAAAQILDWLIAYSVREIISCGFCDTCGHGRKCIFSSIQSPLRRRNPLSAARTFCRNL